MYRGETALRFRRDWVMGEKNPPLGIGVWDPSTLYPMFKNNKILHWVLGVRDKILHWVLGVRQGVLFHPPVRYFLEQT